MANYKKGVIGDLEKSKLTTKKIKEDKETTTYEETIKGARLIYAVAFIIIWLTVIGEIGIQLIAGIAIGFLLNISTLRKTQE